MGGQPIQVSGLRHHSDVVLFDEPTVANPGRIEPAVRDGGDRRCREAKDTSTDRSAGAGARTPTTNAPESRSPSVSMECRRRAQGIRQAVECQQDIDRAGDGDHRSRPAARALRCPRPEIGAADSSSSNSRSMLSVRVSQQKRGSVVPKSPSWDRKLNGLGYKGFSPVGQIGQVVGFVSST